MGLVRKKPLVLVSIFLLAAASIIVFYPIRQQPPEADFINAITTDIPAYLDDDKPVIKVTSVSRHNIKWYVVTLQSVNEVTTVVPVRTVFMQTYNGLVMVVKPTTHFTDADKQEHDGIPESVILELQK